MRCLCGVVLAVLGGFLAGPVRGAEEAKLVLETPAATLELARSPAPHIAQLVHKASGTAVVADPADKNLFVVVLEKDGKSQAIASSQAKRSSAAVEPADGGSKAVLKFSEFEGSDLSVEVVATCRKGEPLIEWSIRVRAGANARLTTVRFPTVHAVPAIGSPDDDVLVLPALPGALIENPAGNWAVHQSVTLQFPGSLSAQFLAYQDRTAGVYLAGRDAESRPMSLVVAKRQTGFALHHEYVPRVEAGRDWESPYPVVLGVTQGTWHESADLYKQWAARQPWCAKTLPQRDDVPAWWKAGPAVHVFEVRTYDANRTCNGSYYPKLLEHVRTFRDKIDGPVVPMLAGWENHRRWTAGDYFPIFDQEAARPVLRQLRQEGFRPFFYLSGLFYTFENEGRDASRIPAADGYLEHFVIDSNSGKPKVYSLNESSPNGTWKRQSYEFCVGDRATEAFFRGVIDRTHGLGVDVLQMDQTVQGAGAACYSTAHGPAPGPGLYQSRDFQSLLARLREHGKRLSPEFVLFHEEPHEQLIPYLDGFHVREYYERQWYRSSPGAVGIPLFSYLYHEYAIGYGGDSAGLSPNKSPWLVRCHAVNLVSGRTPGASVWSGQRSALEAHADQIAMLRNHSRLLKTRAQGCLMLGRMLHPLELDVPKLHYAVYSRGKKADFEGPAVLTSSWLSPEGNVGHLLVNVSDANQPVSMRLDTRNAPTIAQSDADICRPTSGLDFQPLWRSAALPRETRFELKPLEAVFVEIRPCSGAATGK